MKIKLVAVVRVFIILIFVWTIQPLIVQGQNKKGLPNIVYILADDLGYGDVSAYNLQGKIKTPNIDRLASEGMRFTDAHTTASVCTPSRYSILTGRYPWRSRLPVGVLQGYSRTLIESGLPTVASLLKASSYHTAVIGKWHLGLDWTLKEAFRDSLKPDNNKKNLYGIRKEMNPMQIDFTKRPAQGPLTAGFNYSYILPASLDMPPYCYLENQQLVEPLTSETKGNSLNSGFTGPFWRAGLMSPSFQFNEVLPVFTAKAKKFIKERSNSKNPFFLYLPLTAPHTPWVPTKTFAGKSSVGEYGDFALMVDDAVGQVLHILDSMGISDNTMVIFSSDNGPYWRENLVQLYNHKSAGNLRGMKGDAFEGGHRVPFIVRYPGKVKPGTTSNVTTTLANLMATCAELVGNHSSKFKSEDSYSLLPVLTGKSESVAHQPAIVNSSSLGFLSIRKGPWKLITNLGSGGFSAPAKIQPEPGEPIGQLYNLDIDLHEEKNVYKEYPEKVKELTELLEKIKNARKRPTL